MLNIRAVDTVLTPVYQYNEHGHYNSIEVSVSSMYRAQFLQGTAQCCALGGDILGDKDPC